MKLLLLLSSIMSTFTAAAQDFSLFEKKEFVSPDGKKLLYRILYPEGYLNTKKYPLVLVLHGAGERGKDNEKQLTHGGKLFLDSAVRKNFPAIVVFPQCPENEYWASVKIQRDKTPFVLDFDYTRPLSTPLSLAIDLTRELSGSGSVDERRVYITGLSMGGMGTFEAVHHNPDLFASALPICGGGDTVRYSKLKTPFWIFHGEIDAVIDVSYSRAMVAKLKKEKMKVRYSEYPGVNHNSWENAFAEPEFIPWMFSQRAKKTK
jgi:predicted peptidase